MDSNSLVKRHVLNDISSLCIFFGQPRANDTILSHVITYLNDPDWTLRRYDSEKLADILIKVRVTILQVPFLRI
jgi:phosphoinositide-3-kinase regulatory subunit 4